MSEANTSSTSGQAAGEKGKGKEPVQDVSMDEVGDDDEEDTSEDEVDEVNNHIDSAHNCIIN